MWFWRRGARERGKNPARRGRWAALVSVPLRSAEDGARAWAHRVQTEATRSRQTRQPRASPGPVCVKSQSLKRTWRASACHRGRGRVRRVSHGRAHTAEWRSHGPLLMPVPLNHSVSCGSSQRQDGPIPLSPPGTWNSEPQGHR